jgi:glutathione synthase/RimK-type ligase-like ATP-grasp enzyme
VSNPFRPEAFEASLPCNLGTVGRAQKRHEILHAILVLAHRRDTVARHLCHVSRQLKIPFQFIDLTDAYANGEVAHIQMALEKHHTVFARPILLPAIGPSGKKYDRNAHFSVLRRLETIDSVIINRPACSAANWSKPLHLMQLASLGWSIPESIATNDENAALDFIDGHQGNVVYKSCSGMSSIVQKLEPRDRLKMPALRLCPVLFQENVDGDDCRVHVVRGTVIPLWILAKVVDYKNDTEGCSFELRSLPKSIEDLCQATACALGTLLAGIDLKQRHPDKSFVALESNCMPAFDFFDHHLDNKIAKLLIAER